MQLDGKVVTAEAQHTQREHARFLVEEKHADYVLIVKNNQLSLLADLEALDQDAFFPPAVTTDKAHGRLEQGSVQTSTALNTYLDFPYVGEVFCMVRNVTHRKSGRTYRKLSTGSPAPGTDCLF